MEQTSQKLIAVRQAKTNIKEALKKQGQDVDGVPFTEWYKTIENMQTAEDLDAELNEQESLLAEVAATVDALTDKPKDMLQQLMDVKKSCKYLCEKSTGTDLSFISGLDTSEVTDMSYMFDNCLNVTTLNLSNFDTSKVTTMSYMFRYCSALAELNVDNFDTSNVTNMTYMFFACKVLPSLDVSSFNTSKVTNMNNMFSSCYKLTSLDLSGFDTSKVTNMSNMFYDCRELESLNIKGWNLGEVTTMSYFLYANKKLEEIDFTDVDTSKVTNMTGMFGSSQIKTIKNLDMVSVTVNSYTSSMLSSCTNLENLYLKNIRADLAIGYYTTWGMKYSNENLIFIANELWDLTGSTSHRLSMSTPSKTVIKNIYVKLVDVTDEMRANDQYIDNKKPCVACESTDAGAITLEEYIISKNWSVA